MKVVLISRFTFRELSRKKLLLGVLVLSVLFLILYSTGMYYLQQEISRNVGRGIQDTSGIIGATLQLMALYIVAFMAALLAVFTSIGTVATEMDSGTLQAVVPKPIRRWEIIAGKWLGFAAMLAVYVVGMVGLIMVITWIMTGFTPPNPAQGMLLMLLQALTLLTLSIFGSTFLSALATGVAVFMLYGVGWVGGLIEAIGSIVSNRVMTDIGILTSLLVPSDALWKGASYYLQPKFMIIAQAAAPQGDNPFASATPPAIAMIVYALIYVVVIFGAAQWVFANRDL